jgi:hypothetical protein
MLYLAVKYALDDEEAFFPPTVRAGWDEFLELGTIQGKVCGLRMLDLAGDGKRSLFVGCSDGDRLYAWDATEYAPKEVTSQAKLVSKSVRPCGASSRATVVWTW